MNEFYTNEELKLKLQIAQQGLVFLFHRANGENGDRLEVDQSWPSAHSAQETEKV